jgi:hypothetical protein
MRSAIIKRVNRPYGPDNDETAENHQGGHNERGKDAPPGHRWFARPLTEVEVSL